MAKADPYQSYFTEVPIKDGKCEYYWGEQADSIWNQLTDILRPKLNEKEKKED